MLKHQTRKRFGQHFLNDQGVIEQIIHWVHPQKTDQLIEIGPGRGALTEPLLQRGFSLSLIELDRDLITFWQQHKKQSQLSLWAGDVLNFNWDSLTPPYRLIGNLPYNISTPLLFMLLNATNPFEDAHFMLQKEVVDRMTAQPGNSEYGRLSVVLQYAWMMEKLGNVPPEAFTPPPRVQSSVIRIIPRKKIIHEATDLTHFNRLIQQAFKHKRKILSSNLPHISPTLFEQLNIDPTRRAETLSVEEFVRLSNATT